MTYGVNAMMIADDSQIYIIMRQSNRGTGLQGLTLCIQDIIILLCYKIKLQT